MEKAVLVLGSTGSFGGAVARELIRLGRPVRCLVRDKFKARRRFGEPNNLELIEGDVQDMDALRRTAAGCGAIVHGVNYPYHQWVPWMEAATRRVLKVADGKVLLFPGNVYLFGKQTGQPLDENAPFRPDTKKGALRIKLENLLMEASREGRTQTVVLRAGDYYGPTVRNGLVDPIFGNAVQGRTLRAIGRLDIDHQWAYVPDLARVGIDLMDLSCQLPEHTVVHYEGHVASPQKSFLQLVAKRAGRPNLAAKRFPWWLLRLVGVLDPTLRQLMELRYLFDQTVIIAGNGLKQLLPAFQPTPLEESIDETLRSYGWKPPAQFRVG
jgi:nucleoside-diphosphate-sugar epimerase